MNDDQYFLANAYFDGELTDTELRIAEADPDVMSEVGRLRSLQSLLRDSDLPSTSARTAAIAAAMAEFAPATGAGETVSARPVTSGHVTAIRRRRPAASRYLAVAAAVAAIGAVGVVVAGVIGGGSDDDSSGTDLAVSTETLARVDADLTRSASATTLAAATELEAASEQMLAESAPAATTAADIADASSASVTASDIAAGAVDTEVSDTTEMTMVDPTSYSTPYPPTGGPIEPIADRDQTITTPGELAGLGVLLTKLRDAGTLGATPETSCIFDDASIEIVDTTRYRFPPVTSPDVTSPDVTSPAVTSTVLVALIDGDIEGHTLAIDPDTCDILVVGP